jgi:hypothetical protein
MKKMRCTLVAFGLAWAFGIPLQASVGTDEGRPVGVAPGSWERATAIEGRCPSFSWAAVDGAIGYQLAVYEARGAREGHARPVLLEKLPRGVSGWLPDLDRCLQPGRYAWAVRAETAEGWGEWSKPRLFEVRVPDVTLEMRQAAEQVLGQWLAEARISAIEAAALREAPLVPASPASPLSATIRPPQPANFTPIPCQAGSEVFADVPATHPFCSWIQQFYRDRITGGCSTNPLSYCPDAPVTRGQMAVFLERAIHLREPEVEAGAAHTCGLLSNRSLVCWGENGYGQSTPPAGTFTQVSGGNAHTCGVKSDGTAACWGDNSSGQSTPPAGTFTQVSAGGSHTCGVKSDGTAACWGDNGFGQSTPPAGTFTQVSAGAIHTCGVKSDGTAACWGGNSFGQSTPPVGTFTQVSADDAHTCGVKSDGTAACWGHNGAGQSTPPVGTFTQVSAGFRHTCGVKSDGAAACWGFNSSGQSTPPVGTFTQVSAGNAHTCGVKSDGTAACWGDNGFGQSTPPPRFP